MKVQIRNEWGDWYAFSGADHSCLNIRVYSNGAKDEDYEKNPDYAEKNIDEIHICDIDAMIAFLEEARRIRDSGD